MALGKREYVSVKVTASSRNDSSARSELGILSTLSNASRSHNGWWFVRHLLDSSQLQPDSGKHHLGLVFEPLREPLCLYQQRFIDGVIPSDLLRLTLQMVLHGRDYIHSECRFIHAGLCHIAPIRPCNNSLLPCAELKPDNIMVKLEDPSLLKEAARGGFEEPLPQGSS